MNGTATAHGAFTVVNAIPTGQGAAIGVDLETTAEVDLEQGTGPLQVTIQDEPDADPGLARACVRVIEDAYDLTLTGTIETRSQIPIERGMKSSSVAANAIVQAILDALEQPVPPDTILELSIAAARRGEVTITGALDDAAASLLGGLVVTDNRDDEIVHRERLDADHAVVFLVPSSRRPTRTVNDLDRLAPVSRRCLDLVDRDEWHGALTLNGLGVAAALEQGNDPIYRALNAGALAAGVTGTGPAIGALVPPDATRLIRRAWEPYTAEGTSIIETRTRNLQGVTS